MKASELIKELQKLISEHGDLPVNFDGGFGDSQIGEISVYDIKGNDPSYKSPAAEFYLHLGSPSRISTPS